MREFKFRFWLRGIEKMTYVHSLKELAKWGLDLSGSIICMQYTGVKDVNGVEVFEGDLVHFWGGIREVVFHEGRFCIGKDDYFDLFKNQVKVIGNIYENSELLKT